MTCDACNGKGWLLINDSVKKVDDVQRCDECKLFDSDEAARVALAKAWAKIPEQKVQERKRAHDTTIAECVAALISGMNVSKEQFDKVLSQVADEYDAWFIDWVNENANVTGSITEPTIEWS